MNIESETSFVEGFLIRKTEKVRSDIARCWGLLRKEGEEKKANLNYASSAGDDSLLVKQLKSSFKFFGQYKLVKTIVTLESTLHRVAISSDDNWVYAGGNGCKLRKRDMRVTNSSSFSEKSNLHSKEYNVFGLSLDYDNRLWIHDGHTNQVIGFDENLKERVVFNGVCFNRKIP